jgi:glycosyltransferase involved in cell wall biosynthesis
MEAMASSLPVIVTKHGGNLDLINHGENGFLIDEFDVESLAQVVSEILRNENQALRIGQNAHQTIIKNGLSKKECLEFVLNKVEFSS